MVRSTSLLAAPDQRVDLAELGLTVQARDVLFVQEIDRLGLALAEDRGIPAHVHEPEADVPRSLLRPLRRLWVVDVRFRLNTRWAAFGFRGGVHIEHDRDNR
jgi:hypothetical protein